MAKEIFLDVIKEVCCEMSQNLYQSCKAFLSMDAPLTEDFLNEQCQLHVRYALSTNLTILILSLYQILFLLYIYIMEFSTETV